MLMRLVPREIEIGGVEAEVIDDISIIETICAFSKFMILYASKFMQH